MTRSLLRPRKAEAQHNCEAWFYADRTGIDVFIRTLETGPTVVCRITKRQVESWLSLLEKDKP